MFDKLTPARRQWLYGIIVAAIALAVGYKVIAPEHAPMWLDLAANVLGIGGTGTAGYMLSQQRKDGIL
ncbi:holin [Mycobacterium phage Butters]|uniref:Holin n=2 Tax=Charlievirus butters TaxID=2169798 RepID=A0A2Z5HEB6_9CAUD|nr:holin [Mycobacterium phage Butters]AGI12975.1 holin [Mycobacterium phage Butters]AXC38491.1 holin [Mycobacterium phage Rubeelu]